MGEVDNSCWNCDAFYKIIPEYDTIPASIPTLMCKSVKKGEIDYDFSMGMHWCWHRPITRQLIDRMSDSSIETKNEEEE